MLLERLRNAWLVVLKRTLNPLTRRLARSPFGPFSLVQHVGRRSGKQYETPIIVSPIQGGFVIELTYGHDVDWHKNVVAAGGCTLIRHNKAYRIVAFEPMDSAAGRAAFPPLPRLILTLLGRNHFEKWTIAK